MGCADAPAELFVEDGVGPQPEMSNPEASVANTSLRRIFSFRKLHLPPNLGERQGSRLTGQFASISALSSKPWFHAEHISGRLRWYQTSVAFCRMFELQTKQTFLCFRPMSSSQEQPLTYECSGNDLPRSVQPLTDSIFHAWISFGSASFQDMTPTRSAQAQYFRIRSVSRSDLWPARSVNSVLSTSISYNSQG